MKIEKIKQMPKWVEKDIKAICKERGYIPKYFTYLSTNDHELVKILVAAKEHKGKLYMKQVACHGINSDKCFVCDMNFTYIAGYSVGWQKEGLYKHPKWWEDGQWWQNFDSNYDPYSILLNPQFAYRYKEFKYTILEELSGQTIFSYLRLYRQYPEMESLQKMGLAKLYWSTQILKKFRKEPAFRRWLYKNNSVLNEHDFKIADIIGAFNKKQDVLEYSNYMSFKRQYGKQSFDGFADNKDLFKYVMTQNTNVASYLDYIHACKELHIDLSIPKNYMPHDFKYWHNVRIDQFHTLEAERDKKARKELYEKFALIANKYSCLQKLKGDAYVAIIPTSPQDLIKEGDTLHHCVGRMNYDQKFAKETSLIFFIRNISAINTPLVTIEYSPSTKKILQCYGDHDSRPSEEIQNYVYKQWLPYANRKLKKIAA